MKPSFIFFGTSDYAVIVLEALIAEGYIPKLVVTTPDKPAGKHLKLTPPPVKSSAEKHNLEIIQPEKLKDPAVLEKIKNYNPDLSIVVAYGKIIPQAIIDLPKYKTLNLHASLLPKLRGASPIETAILTNEKNTGVTIMLIDELMDHGPVIMQKEVVVEPWPPTASELGERIVGHGAELLINIIPQWIKGKITPQSQDHTLATYTKKIEKVDGLIDLTNDPYKNFLKIQAYADWPKTFFFVEKNGKKVRVIIKKAEYKDGILSILRVVPEGKKEIEYTDFMKQK
ncbi:MAG: methionyl-tRNA formyltransferase [bacterium]|nr:methionyl-tRNA formyltransferase [bacterium]